MNIIGNAMKYTPKGGKIGVTIQQIAMDETHTKVYFQVEDTGIGITPEALKHIFTAFERDKWARDNQIQGTGLGLAIAKELVEKMGGCMKVDSVLGKGSCFFFTISFEKAREPSPGVEKMPEPNHKATAGARILLAEDNDLNREIARALLDMQGYLVEEAINGEQALELFQSRPAGYYQAILMDIKMPIMDGYEATEKIRHVSKEGAGIPIIAMTANAFDEDVKQAKEVGMSAYLAKPIDPDLLACTLEQWILKWREELMLGGLL